MRIIFLDFDGVLVPFKKATKKLRPAAPSPRAIEDLNLLTDLTGAKLVISSDWRKNSTLPALRKMLESWGVTGEVVGCTSQCVQGGRGVEVLDWLESTPYDVESFVVIDDMVEGLENVRRWHVLVEDPVIGFNINHVGFALYLLTVDAEGRMRLEEPCAS